MSKPKIVLYFDVVSPFAYMAFYMLRTSAVFKDSIITYCPVLLGGIMNKTGNAPPMTIKNKGQWIAQERLRWARQFNIPMATDMPPEFPVNTLLVMRALTVISALHPNQLEDILAAIYKSSFVNRRAVHTVEAVKSILDSFLGMPASEEVLSKAATSEFKQRLVQNTDKAIDSGAFGLPWFKATNLRGEEECFWGFDHLGQVCDHLGLEKPQRGTESDGGWRTML